MRKLNDDQVVELWDALDAAVGAVEEAEEILETKHECVLCEAKEPQECEPGCIHGAIREQCRGLEKLKQQLEYDYSEALESRP